MFDSRGSTETIEVLDKEYDTGVLVIYVNMRQQTEAKHRQVECLSSICTQ